MATLKLTPTQQKFYDLLFDGYRHKVSEFVELIPNALGDVNNVSYHMSKLRDFLRPLGEDVVCERIQNTRCYRRVRTIMQGGE